jgi:hypothetical protein
MPHLCDDLHRWANALPVYRFPFDAPALPLNGIYLLFEKGEIAHGANRIVRVGTHTGNDQLRSRLKQHFLVESKDRSIFRKNIGRAFLNKDQDLFLSDWNLDLTARKAKEQHSGRVDMDRQQVIEKRVSGYIQSSFNFVVIPIDEKKQRLRLESRLISTISLCEACRPSKEWLGHFSPKVKIRESGLWLEQELYKEPLSRDELDELQSFGPQCTNE